MVIWELQEEACGRDKWDLALSGSTDGNVFQSYGWGEFKRSSGWIPMRWLCKKPDGAVVAMAQILTKSFSGILKIGWVPGGPVFLFPRSRSQDLAQIVGPLLGEIEANARRSYIRFYSQVPNDPRLAYLFNQHCMRPYFRLNSGYSMHLDLSQSIDVLTKLMTAKHRYYIGKALAQDIQWRAGRDTRLVGDFLRLHAEMVLAKKIASLKANASEVSSLCSILGQQATVFAGYFNNVAVTACLVLTFGTKAFYLMAASGREGRNLGASYAMLYRLLEYLQSQGIQEFDFGGIDHRSPTTAGVNHFKKGFGGGVVEYLGEWEWASAEWLRWGVNLAMRSRSART